jgi:hypothetical protein
MYLALLVICVITGSSEAHEGGKVATYSCGLAHYLRPEFSEIRFSLILVRNVDPDNSATIERITIRDVHGNVVHDSGPRTGMPHPLNTDFSPALDVTVAPPAPLTISAHDISGV